MATHSPYICDDSVAASGTDACNMGDIMQLVRSIAIVGGGTADWAAAGSTVRQ